MPRLTTRQMLKEVRKAIADARDLVSTAEGTCSKDDAKKAHDAALVAIDIAYTYGFYLRNNHAQAVAFVDFRSQACRLAMRAAELPDVAIA